MSNLANRERDRKDAVEWARKLLSNKGSYVVLDTETTGLAAVDEIIQLAIVDLDGDVRFNEDIKPTKLKRISAEATAIHGLTMEKLADRQTFAEHEESIAEALKGKTILTYNAEFDRRMFLQTQRIAGGFLPKGDWECVMLQNARYVGQWSDWRNDYKWPKLTGGDHSALGDCLATLKLLRQMAS